MKVEQLRKAITEFGSSEEKYGIRCVMYQRTCIQSFINIVIFVSKTFIWFHTVSQPFIFLLRPQQIALALLRDTLLLFNDSYCILSTFFIFRLEFLHLTAENSLFSIILLATIRSLKTFFQYPSTQTA